MKNRALVLFSILLLLSVFATAQAPTYLENFDDDTNGQSPAGSFYTFYSTGTSQVQVQGTTDKFLNMQKTGTGLYGFTMEFVDALAYDRLEFDLAAPSTNAGTDALVVDVCANEFSTSTFYRCTNPSGRITHFVFDWIDGNSTWEIEHQGTIIEQGIAAGAERTIRLDFDWTLNQTTLYVDGIEENTAGFSNGGKAVLGGFSAHQALDNSGYTGRWTFDAVTLTGGPEPPAAPAGLQGLITLAADGPSSGRVQATFPVSVDDPNQDDGNFTYTLRANGLDICTDTKDAADGDGIRVAECDFGNVVGTIDFTVTATDTATGLESAQSCIVRLTGGTLHDSGNCGTQGPVNLPGVTGPTIPGVNLNQISDAAGITLEALGWLLGVAITIIMGMAFASQWGPLAGAGGAALGVGVSTALGLFPIWLVILLVLLLAALTFVSRRGG